MKKTLALVLALAMVFSTITVAFAEGTIGADAQICSDLGMLKGETGTVDAAYTATVPTRIQAAVMFLRLKGLEAEALAFTGEANFADANKAAWAKPIMAYLKANPQLGWQGDGTNFNPTNVITAQEYYKVMLEALGYKQTTVDVVGDFAYADVLTFAAGKGLTKVAAVTNYTVNDLAMATVEALKLNVKDSSKSLVATLVAAGKVDETKAVAAGLITAAPVAPAVAVDSATAIGNTVVEVVFEADVDAAAAGNVANYAIEGLAINAATVAGTDTVRLETAAQTTGKLYTLTVGGKSVKFTGVAKVTGAPAIEGVESKDAEEVVITFKDNKNIDFATGTNVANYAIDGVQIAKAEVSADEVTLTTVGLVAKKQYTVKVTNVKSVDGVLLKSASKSFYTRPDTTAPKFTTTAGETAFAAETNQRLVIIFDEKVTKESAENIANYTIKSVVGEEPLTVLTATLSSTGDYKNREVTLTTNVQTANKKYEISILNIADRTKAANTIKTALTKTFYGKKVDEAKPVFGNAVAISRGLVKITFTDADSKLDEASILDINNYTLKKGTEELVVESAEKVSSELGEYVALLTVEDMGVGSYSLEADNITDEFDNELSDAKKYFSVSIDTFASAAFTVDVKDENTIVLTFDKELKEATAEDISNYTINKNINSPLSAEYDNDAKTVTLKTNDLLDNVKYKVTVNGVQDLAANVLNASASDTGSGWDAESPELNDSYAVDKYVVALAFDEAISDTVLGVAQVTFKPTAGANVTLTAKALANDDTVVEFSNYAGTSLTNGVTYSVYSLTGIKDVALVNFVKPTDLNNYSVTGIADDPDRAEVVSISQINGREFDVTMSKNVKDAGTGTVTVGTDTFGYTVDADDNTIVKFVKTANITENAEYSINLSTILTDEHGIPVFDEDDTSTNLTKTTTFYAEYADEENPYIVSVEATDRYTIEITYSEDMDETIDFNTIFSVKNADEDVSKAEMMDTTAPAAIYADGDTVTITLETPLQSIYDYKLIIKSATAKDVAGKTAEEEKDDIFTFNGTDLAQ